MILLTILRLLHIVCAFIWVGLGSALTFFIIPAAAKSDENGMRFLKSIFTTTPIVMVMPIVSGLTTLAGIILYISGSPGYFSAAGNIVLGIGALAGLAATIHGGAFTGRATGVLVKDLANVQQGAISAETMTSLRQSLAKLSADSRVSMTLMVIALVGMGSARYL